MRRQKSAFCSVGFSLAACLGASGCGSNNGDPPTIYAPSGSPAGCASNLDACAGKTPRVEVTVKDEAGSPIQFAMVNSYYPSFSLTNIDPVTYPEADGFGRKKTYLTCTNEQGKAMLCGWDGQNTGTGRDIDVWRSGYLPASVHFDSPVLADGVVRTSEITLQKAAPVGQTSKVLFLPCLTGDEQRMPFMLTYERVEFTVPGFGQVVDALLADPEQPLASFDTLVLDMSCSWAEPYEELLVPAKNEKLWSWIHAGGLVIFGEPSYSGWSTVDAVNCPADPCSNSFFPASYRFELVPKSHGNAKGCARFLHGTIANPAHPLVQGLTFDDWSYVEYRQAAATEAKRFLTWGATRLSTVDTSVWDVLLTVSSSEQEVLDKAACWENDPTLNTTNAAVALMEATYGQGKIIVVHAAFVQATNGQRTGSDQLYDPNAVILKNNIIGYLLKK